MHCTSSVPSYLIDIDVMKFTLALAITEKHANYAMTLG